MAMIYFSVCLIVPYYKKMSIRLTRSLNTEAKTLAAPKAWGFPAGGVKELSGSSFQWSTMNQPYGPEEEN